MVDRDNLTRVEEMSRGECLQLLRRRTLVGRVAFIVEARPMVLPVNYLAEPDAIVFCTTMGTSLSHLRNGAPVAFEVDAGNPFYESGWSVVVQGVAREVTDPSELARLRQGPLRSWAAPSSGHWVRISIEEISGRRIPIRGSMESSP